jgi:hypothetical protein
MARHDAERVELHQHGTTHAICAIVKWKLDNGHWAEHLATAPYQPGDVVGLTLPHWRRYSVDFFEGTCRKHDDIWDEATRQRRFRAIDLQGQNQVFSCDWSLMEKTSWRAMPAMFMPGWACLHEVRIHGVSVERLCDITSDDADAEGLTNFDSRAEFRRLWDSINAKRGHPWESNPWVWVYTSSLVSAALAVDGQLRNNAKVVNSRNG